MSEKYNLQKVTIADERVDGTDKVTGKAKYAAEHAIENIAYGVFVCSTIAKGVITSIDTSKALNTPGVIDVIYYENCPSVPGYGTIASERPKNVNEWRGFKVLYDNKVRFYGQPIALVVAESYESAIGAIRLVKATYQVDPFETDFEKERVNTEKLKQTVTYKRGKEDGFKDASHFIESEYKIPIEVHNPMEMHATIAVWEGVDKITVYDKTQGPKSTQSTIARTFGLLEKNVHVVAENIGGGFGNGLRSWSNVPAACIAAKKLNRPVKVVLNRPQMFTLVGYRPQSWQKIGIGADASGKLLGITHQAISNTSRYEDFREGIVDVSKFLYACEHVNTKYSLLPLDLSTPTWMRGPGEATGCFALESALDELSYKLKMDPIALRLKNFTEVNPENNMPYSANNLKDCYAYGMDKIGWKNRSMIPGKIKENGWHVGYGMAVGVFGAGKGSATIRAILQGDGKLILECAVSDMGPGTATAMTKVAAMALQMPEDRIKFKLGDSDLPPGPSQGGSGTTSTVGSAVDLACTNLKKELKELGLKYHSDFNGKSITDLEVKNEFVQDQKNSNSKITFVDLLKKAGKQNIDLTIASTGNNPQEFKYSAKSFSAHFIKLLVNPKNGAIKIVQVVSTGDAGKIISAKTARSQMLGGVVGGIGMSLSEQVEFDHASGQIINASFAGYKVPLHTDIPPIDVWFVNKPDPYINSIGAKGLGEIAIIGFAAAMSNAVYNAMGIRVRDLPITPQKLGFKKV